MKPLSLITLLIFSLPCVSALSAEQLKTDENSAPPKPMNYYLKPDSRAGDELANNMLSEIAETLGFRGGKAERAAELMAALDKQKTNLDYMYRFEPLIAKGSYVPPVVVEAKDVAHITDNQIRTGNRVYEILSPARFVSNPPTWKTYLKTGLYATPIDMPEAETLPKNSKEKAIWERSIKIGWSKGREKADQILEANFNRLTRDYNGMLRYSTLLQSGMIKQPIISRKALTVTGDSRTMTLGDEVKRIEQPARLDIKKENWKPTIR